MAVMAKKNLHPVQREALRLGLSRQEVADGLDCSAQYVSLLYLGKRRGTDSFKQRIVRWSGGNITPADLLNWEPPKSSKPRKKRARKAHLDDEQTG